MKYFLIALLLFGCSEGHKFKVGDCVLYDVNDDCHKEHESWQPKCSEEIDEIVTVGNLHYRVNVFYHSKKLPDDEYQYIGKWDYRIIVPDSDSKKIECPLILKQRYGPVKE